MNVSDFYDFPFHPKVLDYVSFLAYCRLADRQTQCFIERCNDQVKRKYIFLEFLEVIFLKIL